MSRRTRNSANGNSNVRGPNSALTEFLREQGISAETIRQRHLERQAAANSETATPSGEDEETPNISGADAIEREDEEGEEEEGEEEEELRIAARLKRRRANDLDSDYSEEDDEFTQPVKFGEKADCVECGEKFTLTVYSRFLDAKKGYLCNECNEMIKARERNAKRNHLLARKKRKKLAVALLDKQDDKIPKLQDICITKISTNIDSVEAFGDIGQVNMNKISKILSKNRFLNDQTMTLFLDPNLKELEFWDCSNINSDSLNKIASFCPNIESLTLSMCGQLHNDNLDYFADKLKSLKHLSLNGPFLISESKWQEFFEQVGSHLESFHIANTHRFTNDSLISLLENCPNLTSLTLSRLDGIDALPVMEIMPHYLNNMTHLEISYPTKEDLVTDDTIINLLSINGETLETLVLDGCTALTDRFLVDGVRNFCPSLRNLSLKFLDQVTNDGFVELFSNWTINDGLTNANFQKCIALGDDGLHQFLKHSCLNLIELNLNSCYGLTTNFFYKVFGQSNEDDKSKLKPLLLTYLDIGFVRSVDNSVLKLFSENCPKLSILEVYGNNKCTSRALVRPSLKIIGRQSDSI